MAPVKQRSADADEGVFSLTEELDMATPGRVHLVGRKVSAPW
jgi:hypothetical protein